MKPSRTRRVAQDKGPRPTRRRTRGSTNPGTINGKSDSDSNTQEAPYDNEESQQAQPQRLSSAQRQSTSKRQSTSQQHSTFQQQSTSQAKEDDEFEVEEVVDKKFYQGNTYYKIKWKGWDDPTWELEENCHCEELIKRYEKLVEERSKDEDDDEWEVEEILAKRNTKEGRYEFLVKWKNWQGEPTWLHEDECDTCQNMVAAFENPKLRKLWNFQGSNTKLWTDRATLMRYMRKYARLNGYRVKLLKFEPDYPGNESPLDLDEGLNIGPLCYLNHWYLVIILLNHICTTKKIIICDPMNTLVGVPGARIHPVYKRLHNVYKHFTILKAAMTPMDRSDMCAFYILAAYERALFCLQDNAKFIISNLFFDHARPEFIRTQIAPDTNGQISVNLPIKGSFLDGPKCEFCEILKDTSDEVNIHIKNEHFINEPRQQEPSSGPSTIRDNSVESDTRSRKRSATGLYLTGPSKRTGSKANRRMSN